MEQTDVRRGRDGGPEPTLLAISRELAGARATAVDLQDATSELIGLGAMGAGPSGNLPASVLFRLQSLDRLTQTLDELSRFVAELAAAAPDGWTLDATTAAGALRLRWLAARLAGEADAPPGPPEQSPAQSPAQSVDSFLL